MTRVTPIWCSRFSHRSGSSHHPRIQPFSTKTSGLFSYPLARGHRSVRPFSLPQPSDEVAGAVCVLQGPVSALIVRCERRKTRSILGYERPEDGGRGSLHGVGTTHCQMGKSEPTQGWFSMLCTVARFAPEVPAKDGTESTVPPSNSGEPGIRRKNNRRRPEFQTNRKTHRKRAQSCH